MKLLLIDNYDSFTYMLRHYIELNGAEVCVIRNDCFELLDTGYILSFDGVILSPGPGRPEDAGFLIPLIQSIYTQKPILGICLGHQALGECLGGRLIHANFPHHGVQSELRISDHPMFKGMKTQSKIGRYHSLMLNPKQENINYIETAWSADEEVMAIAHQEYICWGVQYHPESCMTEDGLKIVFNWIEEIKKSA